MNGSAVARDYQKPIWVTELRTRVVQTAIRNCTKFELKVLSEAKTVEILIHLHFGATGN